MVCVVDLLHLNIFYPFSLSHIKHFHYHIGDEESEDNVNKIAGGRGNVVTNLATNRKAIRVIVCL